MLSHPTIEAARYPCHRFQNQCFTLSSSPSRRLGSSSMRSSSTTITYNSKFAGRIQRNLVRPHQAAVASRGLSNRLVAKAQPSSTTAVSATTPSTAVFLEATNALLRGAEADQAIHDFSAAAAAAEAAQAQLQTGASGVFQQLMAADSWFGQVVEIYSMVQQLHHKAVLQKLEQYGSSAGTLPGFAYACLCEATKQPSNKAPADSITLRQLKKLYGMLPGVSDPQEPPQPLVQLAQDLFAAVSCGSRDASTKPLLGMLDDLRLLVPPDLLTLLLDSLAPAAAVAAGRQMPSSARFNHCQWLLASDSASEIAQKADQSRAMVYSSQWKLNHEDCQLASIITEGLITQLLQAAVMARSSCAAAPVPLSDVDSLVSQLDMRNHSNARFVASIAASTVRLLPATITEPLDMQAELVAMWSSSTPGLHETYNMCADPARVPYLLLSLLQHQLFAAVCYTTVMEQVEGKRPITPVVGNDGAFTQMGLLQSWGPVGTVVFQMCNPQALCQTVLHDRWAETQAAAYQLLHPAADEGLTFHEDHKHPWAHHRVDVTHVGGHNVVDTACRLAEVKIRRIGHDCQGAKSLLQGAMAQWQEQTTRFGPLYPAVLDVHKAGWFSLAYWADLIQMTLQLQTQTGQSGPEALEILMQEKHTIFYERQFQRMVLLYMASHNPYPGVYTLSSPLKISSSEAPSKILATELSEGMQGDADGPLLPTDDMSADTTPAMAAAVSAILAQAKKGSLSIAMMEAEVRNQHTAAEKLLTLLKALPGSADHGYTLLMVWMMWIQSIPASSKLQDGIFQSHRMLWRLTSHCAPWYGYAVSQLHVRAAIANCALLGPLLGSEAMSEDLIGWDPDPQKAISPWPLVLLDLDLLARLKSTKQQLLALIQLLAACSQRPETVYTADQLLKPLILSSWNVDALHDSNLQELQPHLQAALVIRITFELGFSALKAKHLFIDLVKEHCNSAVAAAAGQMSGTSVLGKAGWGQEVAVVKLLQTAFRAMCNKPLFTTRELLQVAQLLPLSDDHLKKAILEAAAATGSVESLGKVRQAVLSIATAEAPVLSETSSNADGVPAVQLLTWFPHLEFVMEAAVAISAGLLAERGDPQSAKQQLATLLKPTAAISLNQSGAAAVEELP